MREGGDIEFLVVGTLLGLKLLPSGETERGVAYNIIIPVTISKSDWVEKMLPRFNYKDVHLIEVPKMKSEHLKNVSQYLNSAWKQKHMGHYDMVLNGYEIAGGSIRIHKSNLQRKVFRLMGYSDEEIEQRFGHLLRAFDFGAPPHGGVAAGIDRILMLMMAENTIREVIPFPKTQNAVDLLFDAPSPVSDEQLAELHLNLREE